MIETLEPEVAREARAATPDFDRLARIYRWMEYATFGPYLARCRFAFLPELATCRRALVMGDGDGRFAARLLRANREVEIDTLDASQAMLSTLLRRTGEDAVRVRTYCADAREWRPADEPYDVAVTHFFLDCLTTDEICGLAKRVRGAVSTSGRWVVSEFAVPGGWFGRFVARPVVWLLYCAFGVMTGLQVRRLPNHGSALRNAGFTLERRRVWLCGLLVSELWSVGDGRPREN